MKRINTSGINLDSGVALPADELTVRNGKVYMHDGSTQGGVALGSTIVKGDRPDIVSTLTPVELGSSGMDQVFGPGSQDDASFSVTLPFPVSFAGALHSTIWISSNSYVVFNDSDIGANWIPGGPNDFTTVLQEKPYPLIMIDGRDNSYQQVFTATENGGTTFRVRWEGTASTWGTPGSSNMIWEMVFYAADPSRLDLHIISNARNGDGTTMVSNGSDNLATFNPAAGNSYKIYSDYAGIEATTLKFMNITQSAGQISNVGNGVVEITIPSDTGNITFSNDTISVTGDGLGYPLLINNQGSGGGVEIDYQDGDGNQRHAMWLNGEDGLQIRINSENNGGDQADWNFSTDRRLTLPGGLSTIYSEGESGSDITLSATGNITVNNTSGVWTFGSDAKLTLPVGGDIVDSDGNSVLGGGTTLPSDAAGFLQNDGSGNLAWASAPARLVSPNGDYEVTLDNTGAVQLSSYGVVKNFDHVNMVSDGWVQMQWVDTQTLADADPNATSGPTNWIYVDSGGIHVETNINGNIEGSTQRYDWLFDIYGKLIMPGGGDIVDSDGNSVLGGGFSGNYNDLTNKPTIPDLTGYATETYVTNAVSNLVNSAPGTLNTLNELAQALGNDANFATTIASQLGDKANSADLAAVATSGDYNDLSNTPSIPTNVSELNNDAGYITSWGQANWNEDITESPAYIQNKPSIPANTSDLNNDSGFITNTVDGDILPTTDNTYNLGSPTQQWKHVYVAAGSIYLDNIKLTNQGGKFVATTVVNPGTDQEEPDPESSDAFQGTANILPNNATGYLYNDGEGGLSWSSVGSSDTGNITFTDNTISGAGGSPVIISSPDYSQLDSNNNYFWVDNQGITAEIYNGEDYHDFTFRWLDGRPVLQLPYNGDIVDQNSVSVLAGDFVFSNTTMTVPTDNPLIIKTNFENNDNEFNISNTSVDLYASNSDTNNWAELYLNNDGAHAYANIVVADNNVEKTWSFDYTGVLTLPAGGDIVDSDGNSVLGGGSFSLPITNDDYNSPNLLQATSGDSNWNIGFASNGSNEFYTQLGFFGDGSSTRGVRLLDNDSGKAWLFDGQGNLVLPASGDIKDSNGNSVLGGGGGTTDRLDNGNVQVVLDGDNNLTVPGQLIIGGADSGQESHLVIDAANYWTSIQWKNFSAPQDPGATPFECQAQLLRVFSGTNEVNGHEELVALTAVRPNSTTLNGLMITTSDGKIPDAPYNDGVGTQHNFIFGGNGKLQLPANGDIVDSNGNSVLGTGDVTFDGYRIDQGSVSQGVTNGQLCAQNTSTVIYSAQNYRHSVRLFVQVEGYEGAGSGTWDTQACDVIAVLGFRGNTVSCSTFGITHTSTDPLATFSAQYNSSTHSIDILCTPTNADATVYVSCHAIEINNND